MTTSLAARPGADWATSFSSFTAFHAVTLATFLAWIGLALLIGRRLRGTPGERTLRHGWGAFIVIFQLGTTVFWLLPSNFDLGRSLPLHVCDLVVWPAAFAMFSEARWPRMLVYFFGVGLSTQGFLTPVVEEGYADIRFWLFWIGHTQIIGTGVYLIVVLGYRPSGRDLVQAIAAGVAYVAAMATFDAWLGVNYGYVGPITPDKPTIIDRLGSWPGRVFILVGIVAILFTIMWGIWPVAMRVRAARTPSSPPPEA